MAAARDRIHADPLGRGWTRQHDVARSAAAICLCTDGDTGGLVGPVCADRHLAVQLGRWLTGSWRGRAKLAWNLRGWVVRIKLAVSCACLLSASSMAAVTPPSKAALAAESITINR